MLLPFGRNNTKFDAFWNTIFPASKRLMTCDGSWYGDNRDVRSPAADKLWHGGFFSMSGGSRSDDLTPVKLTLEGVFFVDGGFAGPNQLATWEHTVFAAEAFLACAALARQAHRQGTPPAEFFLQVQTLTGQIDEERMPPPPPPPTLESKLPDPEPIRKSERQMVGMHVHDMRKSLGDEASIDAIAAWADAPVPQFHKL